jgi:hypothetical protein
MREDTPERPNPPPRRPRQTDQHPPTITAPPTHNVGPSSSQLDIITAQNVKDASALIGHAVGDAWLADMNPVGRDWIIKNLQAVLNIPPETMIDMAKNGIAFDPAQLRFAGKLFLAQLTLQDTQHTLKMQMALHMMEKVMKKIWMKV